MFKNGKYAALAALVILILSGCGGYREVKVPVRCDIPARDKPAPVGGVVEQTRDALIYTEGLEQDLNYCRGL